MNGYLNILSGQVQGQDYFVVSNKLKDYMFDGASWLNITSADKVEGSIGSDTNLWTYCKLGFNVILNHPEHFPEYWTGDFGTTLKGLPFSPTKTFKQAAIKCKAIRSFKNFLFALNLTEQGVAYPYSYRWSHPADENGIPFSWDELDLSTLASKESVGGDYGDIIDGLALRDSFCIYTEKAIHVLDYTGDDFVFKRRLLTSSYGCIAPNCIVEAENAHYIMTPSDIIINDGTTVISLLTDNLKHFYANISSLNYKNSFAVVNREKSDIWFCFPEGNYQYPSAAIIYNYVTKKFGLTRLTDSAGKVGTMSSICYGVEIPTAYPWDLLDNTFLTWDTWSLPLESTQYFKGIGLDGELPSIPTVTTTDKWDNTAQSALKTDLFCVGPTFTRIEQLYNAIGSLTPTVTFYEKTNWAIDGQLAIKTVTRIYPHITVQNSVLNVDGTTTIVAGTAKLYVGSHDYNNSDIRWEPANGIEFNPLTDRKIDVRTTGELAAIRFEFRGYADVRFYGYDIEYAINGAR